MARWLLLLAALGLALRLVVLALRMRREGRASRAGRAAFLDEAAALLAAPRRRIEPSGFPRVAGRYAGRAVDLQAVPDALAFRKLPALWLLVTLTEPQPLGGEIRAMRRASGLEPFSVFAELPVEVLPPPGFPEGVTVRASGSGAPPPAATLDRLAALFEADADLKEIVLSPKGLRLVRLVEQAPRAGYLLFREADLGRSPLPSEVARRALDALAALAQEIAAHPRDGRPDPAGSDPAGSGPDRFDPQRPDPVSRGG